MIDSEGFRENVGVIVTNTSRQVFWARRIGQDAWQFPQGGVSEGESPEQTLYRELHEEIGLDPEDVAILAQTKNYLRYHIPPRLQRRHANPVCVGQKQKWFLLKLLCPEQKIRLDLTESPEFDSWRWVNYWYPAYHVVDFKREVYTQALEEFKPVLFNDSR